MVIEFGRRLRYPINEEKLQYRLLPEKGRKTRGPLGLRSLSLLWQSSHAQRRKNSRVSALKNAETANSTTKQITTECLGRWTCNWEMPSSFPSLVASCICSRQFRVEILGHPCKQPVTGFSPTSWDFKPCCVSFNLFVSLSLKSPTREEDN